WVWGKYGTSDGEIKPSKMCRDSHGNIYIVGGFSGNVSSWDTCHIHNVWGTHTDFFLVKCNSAGVGKWARSFGSLAGTGDMVATGVDVDANGNVYVCGIAYGSQFVIGNDTLGSGGFYAKFDSSGNGLWGHVLNS